MTDRQTASRRQRPGVVWEALGAVLAAPRSVTKGTTGQMTDAPQPLDIVDVGGGTGGFAVPMAEQGHRVTVVDPSPDALAALERRARDAGVEVRAVQGDAVGLLDVIRKNSADLVLCHGLLEQLDDVESGLAALVQAMRPGGALSVLAANRNAVVLARAVAGRFGEARHALDDFAGRWGAGDPLLRRFTELQLVELLTGSGLTVGEVHGVRTFADLVSGGLIDSEPEAHEALLELEAATADLPEFRAIAAQLHVLAYRP